MGLREAAADIQGIYGRNCLACKGADKNRLGPGINQRLDVFRIIKLKGGILDDAYPGCLMLVASRSEAETPLQRGYWMLKSF